MSFLLPCPQCGPRDVYEFRWGGAQNRRPPPGSPPDTWVEYLYFRTNPAGPQREWWYHRMGCRRWFLAVRDTRTNAVARTFWAGATPDPDADTSPSTTPEP
jgi:heterotetrameric sarcosine oxidase delta subunit